MISFFKDKKIINRLFARFAQKLKRTIKNFLRFLLRSKRLLRFGRWLLQKTPRTRAALLGMAGLTTPYVPYKTALMGKKSEMADLLPDTAFKIYEVLSRLYAAKANQTKQL